MSPPLGYCTNVHPGESLAELLAILRGPAAEVRRRCRPQGELGVGLWLPLPVARVLAEDEAAAAAVRAALAEGGLVAYTVNAFPIGGFHAARVKEAVYRPTWLEPARLDYTLLACRALTRLLPDGARGSVSTVPLSWKGFGPCDLAGAAAALGALTVELERAAWSRERDLAVALEPEPRCALETTAEAVAFFQEHLLGGAGREVLLQAGWSRAGAEEALRRRVGLCVDTCHVACAFEPLPRALEALAAAGLRVVKGQLSSALELRDADHAAGRRRLAGFAEPRYLHQAAAVLEGGALRQADDLPGLLGPDGALRPEFAGARTARVHFHVPLGWEGDAELGTTRAELEAGLAALARATDHLEVETYTWDVLPEEERRRHGGRVEAMVAAELRWAEEALERARRG